MSDHPTFIVWPGLNSTTLASYVIGTDDTAAGFNSLDLRKCGYSVIISTSELSITIVNYT